MAIHRFKKSTQRKPKYKKGITAPLKLWEPDPTIKDGMFIPDWSHLQDRVKLSRQFFVLEYLKDFDARAALSRMGKNYAHPSIRANEWLKEPYTQWLILQEIEKAREDTIVTRNQILFGLKREANTFYEDNASSRVAALRTLAKIKGMLITKIEGQMTFNGGVIVVPMSGSLDEWENAATDQQQKLKEAVRV